MKPPVGAFQTKRLKPMTTRRIAYWWFRFVFSGRFLETFLVGRRARAAEPFVRRPEEEETQLDLWTSSVDGREGRDSAQ